MDSQPDIWEQYEAAKAEIEASAQSAEEYEERLRELAERMGL